MAASKNAIQSADKDPDDIFWWVEANLHHQFRDPKELADAFDILSKADLFRSHVTKQQNWRFKGLMVDMLSAVSLAKRAEHHEHHGFVPFQTPDRLALLGGSKEKRLLLESVCGRLGRQLHCSARVVRRDYLPYLKIIMKKHKGMAEGLGLEPEDVKAMK
jgi:replication factor C large subunit